MSSVGYGATLELDDGASSAYVAIADLVDIDPPEETATVVSSKRLSLTGGVLTKTATGIRDPGTFTFTYELSAANKARLDLVKGVQKNWKFTLPSVGGNYVKVVPGILTSNKIKAVTAEEIETATATVEVSGQESTP